MKYYICDTIGDGTLDNPYRPMLADFFAANEIYDWSSFPEVIQGEQATESGRHAVTFLSETDQTTVEEILKLVGVKMVEIEDATLVFEVS